MSRHFSVIASLACNYVATACQIVCGLAIVPIAIQHVGEAGYGTWLGLTALAAVGGFADMGVSGVLVVRLSRALEQARHGEARAELLNGLVVAAVSSVVGGFIIFLAVLAAARLSPQSFAASSHGVFIAAAIALASMLSQLSFSLNALPTSQLRPIFTGIVGIAMPVSWLIASVLLVPRFGIIGLAVGLVVRAIVAFIPLGIYNLAFLTRPLGGERCGLDLDRCRSFLMLGATGLAVRWVQSIIGSFDVLCVSTTQGPAAATLYANTARPTSMATSLANGFGGALLPAFTRFLSREQGLPAFRLFLNSLRLTMIMAGGLAIAFVSVRRQFLTAWVGPHFILPVPLSLAIATAAIASTVLSFASYMFGSTGRIMRGQFVLCVEGAVRLALMACGAYLFGSLGMAVAATPTPLVATILMLDGMARFTGVRTYAAESLALAVDAVLIIAGLAAASMLPEFSLQVWQIPLVAASCGGIAILVLTLRSAPLRQMLLEVAHAVLPAGMRQVLPPAVSGVRS
jgi:O-antigen/teichoic acid export membrane protein